MSRSDEMWVRKLFSKAAVAAEDKGIRLLYTDKRGWVQQSINCTVRLQETLSACDRIGVKIEKGKQIQILFCDKTSRKRQIFPPIEKERSAEEIDRHLEDVRPSEEFLQFMKGTDPDNETEVLEKLRQWTKTVMEKQKQTIIAIEDLKRWGMLRPKAAELARLTGCSVILQDPDAWNCCYAEIQLPEDKKSTFWIRDWTRELFVEMVSLSSEVLLEMNAADGFVNVVFFI